MKIWFTHKKTLSGADPRASFFVSIAPEPRDERVTLAKLVMCCSAFLMKQAALNTTGAVHLTDLEVGGLRPEVENCYRGQILCFLAALRETTHILREMTHAF